MDVVPAVTNKHPLVVTRCPRTDPIGRDEHLLTVQDLPVGIFTDGRGPTQIAIARHVRIEHAIAEVNTHAFLRLKAFPAENIHENYNDANSDTY